MALTMQRVRPLIGLAGMIVLAMGNELNETVSDAAIGDVSGGLGFSHDPGTWYQSLYTSAEICGMAFAPWCEETFSIYRFAMFVAAFGVLPAVCVPFTHILSLLYIERWLQGLDTGFTVPMVMAIALRTLPPPIRLWGLACYAMTATFYPNLNFAFAALWTDLVGWQFAFYQSVPFAVIAAVLMWYGMPRDPMELHRFNDFNWVGVLLVVVGVSSGATVLEQGDRLDWFNSPLICVLSVLSVSALPLFIINEILHPMPLLDFRLLRRRNFAYGVVTLNLFVIVSQCSTTLPMLYLQGAMGFRPEQAQIVVTEIACLQFVFLPVMALVLNQPWVDARLVLGTGICLVIAACIGESFVTVHWYRDQFYLWQALQGMAEAMIVVPLVMMATNDLTPADGPFASGLVNAPRATGAAIGAWLIDLVHRWRGGLHSNRLADQLGRERFRTYQAHGVSWQHPAPLLPNGTPRAPQSVLAFREELSKQATVLAISDAFLVFAGVAVIMLVVLLILPVRTYPPRIAVPLQRLPPALKS
ncbi:MFS transporter [Tanticharoenia sakaeratensis]|uniref:MFS transporter n=2 Tax=Tanticharoenia sakaeratensis TaxID=444053 RepID=UPI002156BA99|nr:MFS transporter [Tanticharoenia sakaeratensis]GBQ21307.1 major facilitator superfamily transporter [Tanticharoenia sakaeratensis NBRC 103193]